MIYLISAVLIVLFVFTLHFLKTKRSKSKTLAKDHLSGWTPIQPASFKLSLAKEFQINEKTFFETIENFSNSQPPDSSHEGTSVGAIETAWFIGDYLNKIANVDSTFMASISHLTGKSIEGIADVHKAVTAWPSVADGNISPNLVNKVQGHLAEQKAAQRQSEAGHEVEFPQDSNQEGWDFRVDGVPINVKNTISPSSILAHQAKHPDIPVITGPDSGIGGEAFYFDPAQGIDQLAEVAVIQKGVLIDTALNHAEIVDQTTNALEVVTGNLDSHFPFITLFFSSYREIKLYRERNTTIGRMIKNTALDMAGTGGGALAGLELGSEIGKEFDSFLGPLVGGITGALAGAILGRKFTDKIKYRSLNAAKNKYEQEISAAHAIKLDVSNQAKSSIDNLQATMQHYSNYYIANLNNSKLFYREEIYRQITSTMTEACALLNQARASFKSLVYEYRNKYKSHSLLLRLFWPNEKTYLDKLKFKSVKAKYNQFVKESKELQQSIRKNKYVTTLQTTNCYHLCYRYNLEEIYIKENLRKKAENRRRTIEAFNAHCSTLLNEVLKQRNESIRKCFDNIKEIYKKGKIKLDFNIARIDKAQTSILDEMKALNIKTD